MKQFIDKIYENTKIMKYFVLSLVVIFIFTDVLCENFVSMIYEEQSEFVGFYFIVFFVLAQILFAPLQSGLSDGYGRKKSIIFSLFFSFLCLLFIYIFNMSNRNLSFLSIATISKGIFGNTLPISLALIADIKDKNYRLQFACTTAAYALAYLLLGHITNSFPAGFVKGEFNIYLIFLILIVMFICFILLRNVRAMDIDRETRLNNINSIIYTFKNESSLLLEDIKDPPTNKRLAAFFFWETSLYTILLAPIDFQINKSSQIVQFMMYGYLLGVMLLFILRKIKDKNIIKFGYFISFLSLIPYFVFFKTVDDKTALLRNCFFFHALGNAFLSPAFLSILAKERKNKQGRTYGLTDSVDTLAFLIAYLFIKFYKTLGLNEVYLVSFSFIVFAISWIFYKRFQDIKE